VSHPGRHELLHHALDVARPGLALEFGVGTGDSLRTIASRRPGMTHGFDSFKGLPETWRPHFEAGRFACDRPDVPDAQLVIGMFQDTLPGWLRDHDRRDIAFLHIDCDLYSSTSYVLHTIGDLQPGTVIVFDELVGYHDWPDHEHRALLEWVAATGILLRPIGSVDHGEQVGFVVT